MQRGAIRANSVNEDLVPRGTKSFRKLQLPLRGTPFQIEESSTTIAVEVMVVFLARDFIPGCFTRNLHRFQPVFLHQVLDIPVNRRDPKAPMVAPCRMQRFIGR